MRVAQLAEVKARLSAYLEDVEKNGPIVITRNGRVAAVLIVPTSDDDLEQLLITRSPKFQDMLERSRQSMKAGRVLSHEDFWAEVSKRHEDPI
jgi:prevent-host-death family protein